LTENFALPPVLSQFAGPTAILIAGLAILGFRLLPHGRTKVQESVA